MKYTYNAIFTPEPETQSTLIVHFPDLPGCHTFGVGYNDAISMAEDVLGLWLYHLEEEGEDIPNPTLSQNLTTEGSDFVTSITVDTNSYRQYDNQALAN